jgi:phosphatidylinositol glycan class A protein
MIRENIDLVHGHGTLSSLAHEAMYHSHLLGIRSVFTDHSLFGFGDAVGVLTNKLLAGALRNVDGVICVSNTGYVSSSDRGTLLKGRRENTVLRAQLDPNLVYVIPNALIADQFKPSPVYRKGIDLLVASAPTICDLFPEVRFVVGGDGPKMVELEQMREKYRLQDRITLLGSIKPHDVQSVRRSPLYNI